MKTPTCPARERQDQSSADCEAPVVKYVRWRASRLSLLCGLAILAAAPARAVETAAVPDAAAIAPAVTVVPAESREIVERAVVTGTLVPRDEILVSPEVEGLRITDLLVEEGDRVTKGQVLAKLSLEMIATQEASNAAAIARAEAAIVQARSQIVQAEAANVEARQSLERAQALAKTGNATAAVLEQRVSAAQGAEGRLAAAKGGLQSAQADLATARAAGSEIALRRARTDIRAPEAGIINRRTARIGATATAAAEPLFRLIARGEIELEGEVPETSLARLQVGNPASLDLDDGRRLAGTVRRVYPEVDRATRLGKVRIRLGDDPALRIGAFARGNVEIARRTGIAVPVSSLLYAADGRASVLVVKDGRVEARPVTTGLSAEGFTEIRAGVAAGESVVARAGSFLRDGDRVRPVPAAASSTPIADAAPR
ncbi:efflux RND transporter periplasmic adaptor subunit [Methylobacterium sp. 092160098-2]|jgi:HlyD family secretion protein|uniref:efflux RND transporter periplasmic adaptor subunit n=1 Tax=Methylobacterium TaxID=407 RepID=UPI00034AE192|nr:MULTISPECIES: efflux RND transporter periplasmic adaptor subunit [unclassified Methylobacterium]MDE4910414.1 efflux RND transporter periplasmic adaptor subunit [Methylobacterium sp. 092160098-2]RUP12918.1 MAG: efflux RND transporter periplasmic adaptor subunit [Methylobacterium sp.]WFS07258.1 efflux RND transporter periplasmic adaptor subunit [Methylobacterium sp. 391_Methyba4]